MARVMEVNGKECKAERKSGLKKRFMLSTHENCVEFIFIDPEDKEFKETIKNARKKLETSVALAMPCKIMKNCGSGESDKNKTKLACILEADESQECVWGILNRIFTKTILQEKVRIHYSITIWFANLFLCLKP